MAGRCWVAGEGAVRSRLGFGHALLMGKETPDDAGLLPLGDGRAAVSDERTDDRKMGRTAAVVGSIAAAVEERWTLLSFSVGSEEERHDDFENERPICATDADQIDSNIEEKVADRTASMLSDLVDDGEA
ncbi:hypothetical protein ACLOJK_022780 [Asimina triloba]